jgi:hypothetical protein
VPANPSFYSTPAQLEQIKTTIVAYLRLPFSGDSIPGSLLEATIARVRGAKVLNNYAFVDVVDVNAGIGWQVKSTKAATPVTWKRAKIPERQKLITESNRDAKGLEKLGSAIIDFCNSHAEESFKEYDLHTIGYSRLILHPDWTATYFERVLCTRDKPTIFNNSDFEWRWSSAKKTIKKEQLSALHGINTSTKTKWFAWHGLGENQLHFSGEGHWWPKNESNSITFKLPAEKDKIGLDALLNLLSKVEQ